ncbi:MAG: SPOR domain-containing protein [Bacteroidales bacterium]|nr:SPOR domain-containing protein [Bacteroidales bacterium]
MKIAGYVGDLLYEYECVVIPGLGGFLTRDHAASVHPLKHYFKPPCREIVFNPLLRTNDGLLLNHIARSEKLSYQDAKGRLDRFVLKCISVMEEGKRINFRNIGSIYYNKDQQLVFEPDETQNYLSESFGLSGFVSPPIKREEFQQKVEKVFSKPPINKAAPLKTPYPETDPNPIVNKYRLIASRRPSKLKRQLLIIGTAAVVMFAAWAIMNKHTVQYYYQNYSGYASLVPLFYASPNEFMIRHMDKIPIEKLIIDQKLPEKGWVSNLLRPASNDLVPAEPYQASIEETTNEAGTYEQENLPAADTADILDDFEIQISDTVDEENTVGNTIVSEIISSPIAASAPIEKSKVKKFYIIAGAFKEKQNAEKLIRDLRSKNFESDYAGQTSGGLWRVCFESLENEQQAMLRLQAIKKNENESAWLLVI